MKFVFALLAGFVFSVSMWGQTGGSPSQGWSVEPLLDIAREVPPVVDQQVPPTPAQVPADLEPIPQGEPYYIELGGFTNFVSGNYGQWSGGQGRIMFRHLKGDFAKHFVPILSFATQTRPTGTQATFGLDSYILFNKWFYMLAGVGGAPGDQNIWPSLRYGATGYITIPDTKGLVASVGAAQVRSTSGQYGNIYSVGGLYYHGRAIWSGYLSFNDEFPGNITSKSGAMAVQYGAEKHYWIGFGMSGGRIAYQTIALQPLNVRLESFGPNFFYQKWITRNWGVIFKYDYQDELTAYTRHGIQASIFFEVGPVPPELQRNATVPPAPAH